MVCIKKSVFSLICRARYYQHTPTQKYSIPQKHPQIIPKTPPTTPSQYSLHPHHNIPKNPTKIPTALQQHLPYTPSLTSIIPILPPTTHSNAPIYPYITLPYNLCHYIIKPQIRKNTSSQTYKSNLESNIILIIVKSTNYEHSY